MICFSSSVRMENRKKVEEQQERQLHQTCCDDFHLLTKKHRENGEKKQQQKKPAHWWPNVMPCNYKRPSLTVGHSFGRRSWDEGGASVTHPPVVLCIIRQE